MNNKTHSFYQVDVFSDVPLLGNALAVVVDADDLTDEEMHRF
ncbi:TPA: PhzF family phenazine biosynthesis protein, partial [Klebsiella pneumoniae]|nr:PhzF family phenazine biosynthesis protein [Klebsiella pneumoniae]